MLQDDELSASSIEMLRRALEDAEILLPAQEHLSRPANVGYVLEGLSHHPKAKKLVLNPPNGAAKIDFQQFTVKELRPLAKHMKAHTAEDRKAAIIASIIERLQGIDKQPGFLYICHLWFAMASLAFVSIPTS